MNITESVQTWTRRLRSALGNPRRPLDPRSLTELVVIAEQRHARQESPVA